MSTKPNEIALSFERAEWDIHLGSIPEELEKNSNIVIFRDGEYLLRKNSIGTFFRKQRDYVYKGLEPGPEPFFKFGLPPIPHEILAQQVSFYRATMAKWDQAEAYSIVMYDKQEEKYFLAIPKQKVSKGSVAYSQSEIREAYPSSRYLEVISAHSHNTMNAYFSSIDDRDEQGDLIYMVMGKLDKGQPTFAIRANVAGKQCCFLSLEDIFDINVEQWNEMAPGWNDLHDKTWMEKLNVEADYRSAHFMAPTSSTKRRAWPIGSSRRSRGRVSVYGAHGRQESFDFSDYITQGPDPEWGSMGHVFSEAANLANSGADETKLLIDVFNTLIDSGYTSKIFTALKFSNLENLYEFEVDNDDDLLDPISVMPDSYFEES